MDKMRNELELNYNLPLFHEHSKIKSEGSLREFWIAIQILITSPHYINRNIVCTANKLCAKIKNDNFSFNSLLEQLLSSFKKTTTFVDQMKCDFLTMTHECVTIKEIFESLCEIDNRSNDYFIICNENITKSNNDQTKNQEVTLIDGMTKSCYMLAFTTCSETNSYQITQRLPYKLGYEEGEISLYAYSPAVQNEKYINWIQNKLFNKICSWSKPREEKKDSPQNCQSLSLVEKEKYAILYHELKHKYGKTMCEIWPDNTDPSKYVYEDIAIAAYLLLTWEQSSLHENSHEKQTFVDLGCGNGLLVHILCSEGHNGYGLDLRKRGLWDKYPKTTKLVEKPFIPTTDTFPEVDWLIGNHSDEITPWLPITATRSSKTCKYFVIPCCPFELNGKKYQRKVSSNTVYDDFLYYVRDISNMCGFITQFDKLRIPSTKRTCLIGWKRNLAENNYNDLCCAMESYVKRECQLLSEYVVREKIEKVQNCTQINKNIQVEIVRKIVNSLLEKNNNTGEWNSGGTLSVKELADLIPKTLLSQLKSECGGLQTLLKNQNIFEIRNGTVSLSRPKTISEIKELYVVHKSSDNRMMLKRKKSSHNGENKYKKICDVDIDFFLQKKDCWYFNNHPDGCPLSDANCSFKH